jgi:hypothetical protein
MTVIKLTSYKIEGIGTAEFSDGTTGKLGVTLDVDQRPISDDNYLQGREDWIAAAVEHGTAELRLADGGHISITISPLYKRFALIRPTNAKPIPTEIETMRRVLVIAGDATLILDAEKIGRVTLQNQTADGVPSLLEVYGESGLMEAASHRKTVKLKFLGLTFRTGVADYYQGSHTLLVDAEPLFRAMAERVKAMAEHRRAVDRSWR